MRHGCITEDGWEAMEKASHIESLLCIDCPPYFAAAPWSLLLVRSVIDAMTMSKLNVLQLHLNDMARVP